MNQRAHLAVAAVVLSFGGLCLWRSARAADVPLASQQAVIPVNQGPAPKVDIVFALDTTGSMGGLLEGAKTKIWEIARRAREGKPAPELRVGLVAYRDVGDEYVTRVLDLTSDMDKVYATLTGFQANGGGDGPEHVLKGLHDAIDGVHWSEDGNAVKLVYLVGDAPPHFDYKDGLTLDGVMKDAAKGGIRVSAIRCGASADTLAVWTQIAQRTDGEVSSIEQTGGVAVVATPFDDELARLNAELSRTEIHWGTAADRREADSVVQKNLEAPHAAQADRASFYGVAAAASAAPTKNDLAAAPTATAVASVPVDQLPETMQRMGPEERVRFVQQKQKEREAVLAQVRDASARRDAFLHASAPKPAASAFDTKVYDSLRKAGAKKGISY